MTAPPDRETSRSRRTPRILQSLNRAFEGVIHVLRSERNMRIHFAVATIVLILAFSYGVTKLELMALLVAISFVLIAEMVNTAIEATIDLAATSFDPLAKAAKDIAGAAAYLADRDEVTSGEVGTVGFCMGGSLALWSATLSDHIVAAVGFYPPLPWERMSPQWSNYAGKAAVIHCSEGDGTSAAPGIQQAKRAIEAAGGDCVLFDYPGTDHAFFNDERPEVYHSAAADNAWERTLALFASRLG